MIFFTNSPRENKIDNISPDYQMLLFHFNILPTIPEGVDDIILKTRRTSAGGVHYNKI